MADWGESTVRWYLRGPVIWRHRDATAEELAERIRRVLSGEAQSVSDPLPADFYGAVADCRVLYGSDE